MIPSICYSWLCNCLTGSVSFTNVSEDTSISDMAPHGCKKAATSLSSLSSCMYSKSQKETRFYYLVSPYQHINKG